MTGELRDCALQFSVPAALSTCCPHHLKSEFAFYKRRYIGLYKLPGSTEKITGLEQTTHLTYAMFFFCPSGLFVAQQVEDVYSSTSSLQCLLTWEEPEVKIPLLCIVLQEPLDVRETAHSCNVGLMAI